MTDHTSERDRVGHTPGPWKACGTIYEHMNAEVRSGAKGEGGAIALVWNDTDSAFANARLIAAAPDHALIAAALCAGGARWEGTEFCIDGLRHSTRLDEFGVPVMTGGMRAAIAKTISPSNGGSGE